LTPAAGPFPEASASAITELGVTSGLAIGTSVSPGVAGFTVGKTIIGATSTADPDGRYDACLQLAEYAKAQGWSTFARVGVTPGNDYPDGAVLAPYLGGKDGTLLLSLSTSLSDASATAMKNHAKEITRVDFVGVGWAVYRHVKSLNSPRVTAVTTASGPVAGGGKVILTGTALNTVTAVKVGKITLGSSAWRIDSSTQITILSMPAGEGPGPVEVIVTNFWGNSPANTKDVYTYVRDGYAYAGEAVVAEALKYLGTPYTWAGASPTTGFDCSGFVMYVYSKFGVTLPHYSRYQATYGTAVAKEDLLPGDLVFFYTPISHVGMYVGGGMMINAPRSGDLVTVENAYRSSYVTARRLISPYPRYQQDNSSFAYGGTWTKNASASSASGGSFSYANVSGASITARFTGTYLAWVTKKSPVYGIAEVVLDGGDPQTVDLYNSSEVWQQTVWNTGTLDDGSHTVTITWTGAKNASATDTNIGVDAFEIFGQLEQATVAPPATSPDTPPDTPPAPSGATYTGLRGVDRYETALLVSQAMYPAALPAGAGLVLAPGVTFQEALCGAPLAAAYGGPVLLNSTTILQSTVRNEIVRLAPTYVFCIGLTDAVVNAVKTALPGATVTAIRGANVYETSYKVAKALGEKVGDMSGASAIITRGDVFPDAISVSPLACAKKWPILLTESGDARALNAYATQALTELGISTILKVGTYVTPPEWVTGLANLSGADRYQTNRNVAEWSKTNAGLSFTHTGLATGDKFPDALAAGPYLALDNGILLLTPLNGPLPSSVSGVLAANASSVGHLSLIAMIEPVISQVKALVPRASTPGTGFVVCIDPGHQAVADLSLEPVGPGSTDMKARVSAGTSGVVTKTPESQLVLTISLKLRDALEAEGITVVMTRTTQDVNISNSERAKLANACGADLFVRVHANGASSASMHGITVLYPANIAGWTDDIAVESKAAATLMLKELVAATGAANLGLMERSDMAGFNWADVPAVIPEVGFMTNSAEDQLMATAAYQDKIVRGLTASILTYLGVEQ
jgi:N-acetylmuramoyl-L-alanine amidase